jgi:hypothetical protein
LDGIDIEFVMDTLCAAGCRHLRELWLGDVFLSAIPDALNQLAASLPHLEHFALDLCLDEGNEVCACMEEMCEALPCKVRHIVKCWDEINGTDEEKLEQMESLRAEISVSSFLPSRLHTQ